jgi:hypothetical protein
MPEACYRACLSFNIWHPGFHAGLSTSLTQSFLVLDVQALWHLQKGTQDVPELLASQAETDRVGSTGKDHKLAVLYRKLAEEVEQILLSGDAVFPAHDEHRRFHLQRVDDGQPRGYIEIGPGGNGIADFNSASTMASATAGSDVPGLSRVKMLRIISRSRGRRL